MSIIRLKNVSKFYYSKGVVASGFSKVSVSFDIGEFVAITGESGSGKSTLLNVISGLDTYEDGEMYINGLETSHYTEKDFEDYRRKYIGNIFQNFNLVNSYTVYQNIELVLLLNGNKKKNIKKNVISLIKKVGLYKFRNTKVSKLSGGQKQRVAIARALAKDTPIIIADEPTGNLDSKSAKEIIKLLSEISHDKLVIVVTHNYDQVEEYVTRKIKMHDGRILEDKKLREIVPVNKEDDVSYKNITFLNKIRISLRNTFNIIPKFLLLIIVYLFITVSIMGEYASFREQEYISDKSGSNYIFSNSSDKRIIIKNNNSAFTEGDYDKILSLSNVDYLVKNDLLLDTYISITDNENFWINGTVNNIDNFKGNVDRGRMPSTPNEIVVEGNSNDYYIGVSADNILDRELHFERFEGGELDSLVVKIVGIKYNNNYDYNNILYLSDELIDSYSFQINRSYSKVNIMFLNKYRSSETYGSNRIIPNSNVPVGSAYITSDLNIECPKENCINEPLVVNVDNLYYKDSIKLNVTQTYNSKNIKTLLGIDDFEENNGTIYINTDDYNNLFNKGNFQSSIFVKDIKSIDKTVNELNNLGFTTLALKDTLVQSSTSSIIKIIQAIVTVVLVVVLFFISYFVIRVILKSRNKYFSTIRILGATKKTSKDLLIMELLTISNLAYLGFIIFLYLNNIGIFDVKFAKTILNYLTLKDYIVLYIILTLMSYLISQKTAKKLFKKSAISTLNEEV